MEPHRAQPATAAEGKGIGVRLDDNDFSRSDLNSWMWPSNLGSGVRLGYGHDGSGVYAPHLDPDTPWQFARQQDRGYHFYNIGQTRTLVSPINTGTGLRYLRKRIPAALVKQVLPESYVPSDLIGNLLHEAHRIKSSRSYDPMKGSLIAVGSLNRTSKDQNDQELIIPSIAFASGPTGTNLSLGRLEFEPEELWSSTPDGVVYAPRIISVNKVDIGATVEQIEFADPEPSVSPYVMVRARTGTILVRASVKGTELKAYSKFEIPMETMPNAPDALHAHSTFNPWNWAEIGIINARGTWGIWDAANDFSDPIVSGSIPTADATSSQWKRFLWGADDKTVVSANRRYVHLYDIRSPETVETVLSYPNGVYEIRDMARSKINDNEMFVLTTERLLWMDIRRPTKPILSWDHFIDSQDPSLQMTSTVIDDVALFTLYSQMMPASVVYQFSRSNGLPISPQDPYYYLSNADSVTQNLVTIPLQSDTQAEVTMAASLNLSTDYGLYSQILSTNKQIRVAYADDHEVEFDELADQEISDEELPGDDTDDCSIVPAPYFTSMESDYSLLYSFLFEKENLPEISRRDDNDLQEYASALGAMIKHQFEGTERCDTVRIGSLVPPPKLFEDVDSFASMIDQLSEYYRNTNIQVRCLDANLDTIFDHLVKGIKERYEFLLSIWVTPLNEQQVDPLVIVRRLKLCQYISVELAISLTGVQFDRKNQPRDVNKALRGVSKYSTFDASNVQLTGATQRLLNEWTLGNDPESYEWVKFTVPRPAETEVSEENEEEEFVQSQARNQSDFTDGETSRFTDTASQTKRQKSSQRPKSTRKKKRKEGFV
jgi:hypothetical protein